MADKLELTVQKRNIFGKKLTSLRGSDFIPAIVYGHNFDSIPLQVKYLDFEKVFKKAGETTMIYLKYNGESYPVVVKDIQKDSVTDRVIHIDFYRVSLKEKITANVPLVFVGESEAVKVGGVLVKVIDEVEVEAFPQDLPHQLEVDISGLKNFGDDILIKDLKISDKVEILAKPDEVVATVQEPRKEEVEEAPAAEVEEVEVVKKEEKEEEEGEEVKEEEEEKKE